MYRLFISYTRDDREWVGKLAQALSAAWTDWAVWLDWYMEGGQNIDRAIDAALTEAHCVLVVWSKKSIESRWVRDEADAAVLSGKLLPIFMEKKIQQPWGFRRISSVDMTDWDGTAGAAVLHELVTHIESRIGVNSNTTREDLKTFDALDELTELPNRKLFEDRLTQALARAERARHEGNKLALMFLDLDGFKQVNDTLGHSAGDDLLRKTAERIKSCVRGTDTVFRLGGDEFTVILEDIDGAETAATKAEEISKKIGDQFELRKGFANVTASIGIAIYPSDGVSKEELLQAADQAMYSAKREKRNYQLFNPSIRAKVAQQVTWENDLRHALERNAYVVFYQPIFSVSDNIYYPKERLVCIEALIRWVHLRERFVPPGEFVPFLEKKRLIEPVGEWILRTACSQNKQWQDEGLPKVPIAVNVSPVQILNRDFTQVVNSILVDTNFEPNYLQLEIGLSELLLTNYNEARYSIDTLKEMGVHIALDRFDTGCYPLSNLNDFPMDTIKIEWSAGNNGSRSDNRRKTAITNSIVQLAHGLKAECVAVGVENNESLHLLDALGIDQVQGELFTKPLCNDDFTKYWWAQINNHAK
jgi:diguanylate cyclase (GGDEF)-like protein